MKYIRSLKCSYKYQIKPETTNTLCKIMMTISKTVSLIVRRRIKSLHGIVYIQKYIISSKSRKWIICTKNCIYSDIWKWFFSPFQSQMKLQVMLIPRRLFHNYKYCLLLLHALTRKIEYWKIKEFNLIYRCHNIFKQYKYSRWGVSIVLMTKCVILMMIWMLWKNQ